MPLIPLFPLSTVLFPGNTLPLHIFEPRYRLMIGECIEQGQPFGVVLIRSGAEVGGGAEPHEVGTTARIARVQQLPDGRMNIVAVGARRFRIRSLDHGRPYLSGEVEYVDREEEAGERIQRAAELVGNLFTEYYRLTLTLGDQWTRRVGLPSQPGMLADFVGGRLDVDSKLKQRLLEIDSALECLELEATTLSEALRELRRQVQSAQLRKFADFGKMN